MSEEYLYGGRIRTLLGKVGGKAMSERVRGGRDDNSEKLFIPFYLHLEVIGRYADLDFAAVFSAVGNKERRIIVVFTRQEVLFEKHLDTVGKIHKALLFAF